MSGLIALLDDVAGLAKVAAASVDDVATQAVKASAKTAGAVIDDAAVAPKYVQGFAAARELPIIWRIAKGSMFNKMVFLLPAALALNAFAPWMVWPLLMLGGGYLCFEGAEKVAHSIGLVKHHPIEEGPGKEDVIDNPAHLEEEKASGAIKTDFILSAEIMTIALSAIPESNFWMEAATLATVAVMITVIVYGSVALIVKADDVGLHMAKEGHLGLTRRVGLGIVNFMPSFLWLLTVIGTAAMIWVGGSIILHSLHELGLHLPYEWIKEKAAALAYMVGGPTGFLKWFFTAAMDGVFGLAVGLALIPIGTKIVAPIWRAIFARKT